MRYRTVIIDVDSTLSRIEGIEWLSRRCTSEVQSRIRETTEAAMRGELALESVYGERLQLVNPSVADVGALSEAYIASIADGALDVINRFRDSGIRVVLVSGGIRQAIVPLARHVGLSDEDVFAVPIIFTNAGEYVNYDVDSLLARRGGKPALVGQLDLPGPVFSVGDGITDAELKSVVETFAAFVGVVEYESVVRVADYVVKSFDELPALVL